MHATTRKYEIQKALAHAKRGERHSIDHHRISELFNENIARYRAMTDAEWIAYLEERKEQEG